MSVTVKSKRPKISPDGLWLLIVFKTFSPDQEIPPVRLEDLPQEEREWATAHLTRIVQSVRTEADLNRLFRVLEQVKDKDAFDTLERLSMHF